MKAYLLFLFTVCSVSLSAQTIYYISPQGDDCNNGSMYAPVKTIEKAQQMARLEKGEVTLFLRGGEYRLAQSLVFTLEDGNHQKHLTLCAYPGEQPVLKGSITLSLDWKPYRGEVMQAKVNQSVNIDMLVVNGNIRYMARYPNYDPDAVRFNGTSADATSPARVKKWKNPVGGLLHAMHISDWGDFHYRITGKDKNGELILEGGWQNNRRYGISHENRMVENIFEELDAPGEWYYDDAKSIMYYYPMPGEDIYRATIEVPQLKHLIELRGSEKEPVENITIKGVELTQTTRTFMEKYEPLLRSDWTIYRGGAVFFEGTENCGLYNAYLHNLGGNAVFFSNYNKYSTVSSSHFTRIGASAICFVGDPQAVYSPSFEYGQFISLEDIDRSIGSKTNNYPSNCLVYDNLIHTIGLFEKQITGVELSMCHSITLSHNSIYDTPRAGINVSEGTWGGHIIEHNDVFDTVKETGDHGSFNSWGRDRFWHWDRLAMDTIVEKEPALVLADAILPVVMRNNRFRCDRGWDIDLDDGATNYHIYNNLCLNGGIKLREGFYRVVENNILVNNTLHPHVWFKNSGDVFIRNIVMSPYQPIRIPEWGTLVDYNIFIDSLSYKAARENHTDLHSIVYPVNFVDPLFGDYRVSNDATKVFRIGFQNFDMDNFGVVSPHLKVLSQAPNMSLPVMANENSASNVVLWHGWHIKNLDTPGERSATGMDSERGVYVVTSVAFDNPLRDILRANDVILKFAGHSINKLDELYEAIRKTDLEHSQKIVIFRNQKENKITIPERTLLLTE